MPASNSSPATPERLRRFFAGWRGDAWAIGTLLLLAAYFIAASWRKWTDPLVDAGPQLHTLWRVSQGAQLYHDVTWNYGPLAPFLGALLFKILGPGIIVLAIANLFVYALILAAAYWIFRCAWGVLGAFAALAVFISVFSFSRINSIANYNYATPYANEATLGFLLILITALVAVRWCRGPSWRVAGTLGLCGGVAAVLKPEFMLAGGAVGLLALLVRWRQRQPVGLTEYLAALVGVALPTLLFTAWFCRYESCGAAFIDASKAWWLVVVDRGQSVTQQQQLFLGLNHPLQSAFIELQSAAKSVAAIAAICLAGIAINRPWRGPTKTAVILAAAVLVYLLRPSPGWLYVGASFPLLMVIIVFVLAAQAWFAVKQTNRANERTLMALALAVMGAAMLARMFLRARIGHLGFYQAALAGMVIAAFLVAELPKWAGAGEFGRWLVAGGSALALAIGCANIALESHAALADQTFAVGAGRDRFYCLPPDTDAAGKIINPSTGQLVAWVVDFLRTAPPEATVCVLPEGEMINYLSRRPDPLHSARSEQEIIDRFALTQPDYVVFISRDLSETGLKEYGATGGPGYSIKRWLIENKYAPVAETGGNPLVSSSEPGAIPGAVILKKPAALAPGPKTP